MKDYYIEREVDGHPICFNGCSQTKKEIVNDLNDMLSTITSLYKAEKQLQKDKVELVDALDEAHSLAAIPDHEWGDEEVTKQEEILEIINKHNSIGEDK